MRRTASTLSGFARDQRGATAIEYALLASLIALVLIGSFMAVGDRLGGGYDSTAQRLIDGMG